MGKTGFDKATGSGDDVVDVETTESAAPGVPRTMFTRDKQVDMKNIQVSQLRIAQGMTAEVKERKAQIGDLVLSNFGPQQSVILIPLISQDIRVYKPDPKAAAKCHAPTGNFGFGDPKNARCRSGARNRPTGSPRLRRARMV